MPHSTVWRCRACGRELGTIIGPTLSLQDVPVLATPQGLVVTCPECRTERLWTWRPVRAA